MAKKNIAKQPDFFAWQKDTLAEAAENRQLMQSNPVSESDIMAECEKMVAAGYLPHCTEAFKRLANYMAWRKHKTKRGLLLHGPCGTGKTLWLRKFGGMKVHAASELVKLYERNAGAFTDIITPVAYDVMPPGSFDLCIDEVADEPTLNDYGTKKEVIGDAIMMRYNLFMNRGAKTLFSTNKTPGELEKRYGTRCVSRLCEMTTMVEFVGKDLRRA